MKVLQTLFLTLFCVLLLSACSFKPSPEPAPKMLSIEPEFKPTKTQFQSHKSIKIALPQSPFYLRSTRVAFVKGGEFGTYKSLRFQNAPTDMLFFLLAKNFEQDKIFKAVTNSNSLVRADYLLESKIYNFEQVFKEGESFIHIALSLNLIDLKTQNLISSKFFEYELKLKDESEQALVSGVEQALSELLSDILMWCDASLRAQR